MSHHLSPSPLAALAAIALLSTARPAAADTITVAKGSAVPTIQQGVDLAKFGDVVVVKAGTYRENVRIGSEDHDLELRAEGAVLIDARLAGGKGGGPGIFIDTDGVTVRGFTIENAAPELPPILLDGFGIRSSGDDTRIEDCEVRSCRFGIRVEGNRTILTECTVRGCLLGISIFGDDLIAEDLRLEDLSDVGIAVTGNRTRIEDCRAVSSGSVLTVLGDDCAVVDNRLERSNIAIRVTGARARIEDNFIRSMRLAAIAAVGTEVEVLDNNIRDIGILLSGIDDAPGIFVDGSGGMVEDNEVSNCRAEGLALAQGSSFAIVQDNRFTHCGHLEGAAVRVQGSLHFIAGNVVRDGAGDGFRIEGSECFVTENQALDNGRDGFDVEPGAVFALVTENVAKGNRAEGFDNGGANTSFTDNKATKNRIDYGSLLPFASFTGNKSSDGSGAGTLSEID